MSTPCKSLADTNGGSCPVRYTFSSFPYNRHRKQRLAFSRAVDKDYLLSAKVRTISEFTKFWSDNFVLMQKKSQLRSSAANRP